MNKNPINFSFYGIGVCIEIEDSDILSVAEHDFSYFRADIKQIDLRIAYHFINSPFKTRKHQI